jgi:small subunit ribosomal protein S6
VKAQTSATRAYEALFILRMDAAAAQDQTDRSVQQINDTITKHGGQVTAQQLWGRRKLAYPIAKQREGVYVLAHFTAEPKVVPTLRQTFRLNETLLRSLIVIQSPAQSAPLPAPVEHGESQ